MLFTAGCLTGVAGLMLVALLENMRATGVDHDETIVQTLHHSLRATIPWVVPPPPPLTRTRPSLTRPRTWLTRTRTSDTRPRIHPTRTRNGLAELTQSLAILREAAATVTEYIGRHSYDKKSTEAEWRHRWAMYDTAAWPYGPAAPETIAHSRHDITAGHLLDMRPVICAGRGKTGELPLITWTMKVSEGNLLDLLE